ncbi:MAG: CBS domain-containing protein [Desulfofustis sp.]
MKARDILEDKGTRVVTIHEDNMLVDVMSHFLVNRVGSLVVVDKFDNILGIVAPLDVLEAVNRDPELITTMKVEEVMSTNVIVANPDEEVGRLMAIMTENRIRHIPIIDAGKLAGIVSIGDVVKAQLTVHEVHISYLKDYIEGKYPA